MISKDDIEVRIDDNGFTQKSQQIESLSPKQIDYKIYQLKKKENRLDQYFSITIIISMIIFAIYAYLMISGKPVPEYLTFLVGGVVAYYLLKHPHDS